MHANDEALDLDGIRRIEIRVEAHREDGVDAAAAHQRTDDVLDQAGVDGGIDGQDDQFHGHDAIAFVQLSVVECQHRHGEGLTSPAVLPPARNGSKPVTDHADQPAAARHVPIKRNGASTGSQLERSVDQIELVAHRRVSQGVALDVLWRSFVG